MKVKIIMVILLLTPFGLNTLFSQTPHTSRDNYTGDWENPISWDPVWNIPQTSVVDFDVTINGYITCNGPLSFDGEDNILTVNDTLVIFGDLTLGNNSDLKVNENGILIVWGNLNASNKTNISERAYIIVLGNYTKSGSVNSGSFISYTSPTNLFIGGSIQPGLNSVLFPVFDCPGVNPYDSSNCNYGNIADLKNDPIYSFFQSTCNIATPTITASGPATFCSGDSVILTSGAGTTYLWSTGSTNQSIKVIASGSYTVQVTNANGCLSESSAAIVVTVNALPVTPTITAGGPTAFCAGDSVNLTSSGGTTYLWSTGATSQSINVTTTGNYTVQITNTSGCKSEVSIPAIVTVNALPETPVITPNGPTTFCNGDSVTLTSSAGNTFLWSTGATSQSIHVSTGGSYTVQIKNTNGCESAASAATIVNVNELPIVDAGTVLVIPYGTSATIDAIVTGTPPFNYSWSPSSLLLDALMEDPTTIELTSTTQFTLTAVSTTNMCSNTDKVDITISGGALSVNPTAIPGTICAGEAVQLNALAGGGSGPYIYAWTSVPAGFTSDLANPVAYPTVNTTYNVYVSDDFTNVNSQVAVMVNSLPAKPTITASGPTTFCSGDSVTLTSSAGLSYLWSTGATIPDIKVSSAGNYTVKVTDVNGCLSDPSVTTTVIVNALPETPTITANGPTTFCSGDSVTLTSSAGSTYLWSNGAITQSINATISGSYTVQITNAGGCGNEASVPILVNVHNIPETPVIKPEGPIEFCAGDKVILTSSEGTSYLWSTGATTPSININESGSYTVQVANSEGCQSAPSAPVLTISHPLPAVPTVTPSGPLSFCTGNVITLTSGLATKYLWSTGDTTQSITVDQGGIYVVGNIDTNGCMSTTQTSLVENDLPDLNLSITDNSGIENNDGIICSGETATLTASGGVSYSWSSGETGPEITKTIGASYSVTGSDINGCQNTADTLIIVNDLPAPGLTVTDNSGIEINDGIICSGETATLTATGGVNYIWSSGETVSEITKNTAGTYFVTITDANGCINTAGTSVTVVNSEAFAGDDREVCGQKYTHIATSNTGSGTWTVTSGQGNVIFSPDANDPSASVTISQYGSYQFTWTVVYENCPASSDVTIVFHNIPDANAGADRLLNYTFSTTMQADLLPSETGEWSLVSGTGIFDDVSSPSASVSGLLPGENVFSWTVTDELCSDSDSITIEVSDLFIPQVITPNGDSKNDLFIIDAITDTRQAELIIYNRWGNEVYSNPKYMNEWDGKNNDGIELTNDTYFYVVKFMHGISDKGFVVIKR